MATPTSKQAAVAAQLGVTSQDMPAFIELYLALEEERSRTLSAKDLENWKDILAEHPAEASVSAFIEENAEEIGKVLEGISGSSLSSRRSFEQRLIFTCVYGRTSAGNPIPFLDALQQVLDEIKSRDTLGKQIHAPFTLQDGIFDDRHLQIRKVAYPYRPACASRTGDKTLDCKSSDGTLVGYICMGGRGYADDLSVLPYCQGRGIAKALICGAAKRLAKQKVKKFELHVRAANCSAMGLYSSLGFAKSEKCYPGWYDWHGGYEMEAESVEVAARMPKPGFKDLNV
eukprot:TRINITY_DN79457_c0_g1_i1.p1 TRINITY_DN79457_c0_g1~~TRINITY_DN79457_c0_g1_i1.p1  ORF type:complete len:286 (+),score=47.67 TRINITY_DN79457_c0_g1_i1:41-898(+)